VGEREKREVSLFSPTGEREKREKCLSLSLSLSLFLPAAGGRHADRTEQCAITLTLTLFTPKRRG